MDAVLGLMEEIKFSDCLSFVLLSVCGKGIRSSRIKGIFIHNDNKKKQLKVFFEMVL